MHSNVGKGERKSEGILSGRLCKPVERKDALNGLPLFVKIQEETP